MEIASLQLFRRKTNLAVSVDPLYWHLELQEFGKNFLVASFAAKS